VPATNAGHVVTGIKGVPTLSEEHLKPCTIHRLRCRGHANVSQVACAVSRRNINAAAQRDRKMREITAYTPLLVVRLPSGFHRIRMLVTELKMLVHVATYCLNQRPSFGMVAKFGPSKLDKVICFANQPNRDLLLQQPARGAAVVTREYLRGSEIGPIGWIYCVIRFDSRARAHTGKSICAAILSNMP
jgi:hypothetical protein